MARQRVRQLLPDLHLGFFRPGPRNALTDVPGVLVSTLSIHDNARPDSQSASSINTGVTAILPRTDWFDRACYAAIHSFNGSGEITGSHWINETGLLNSPIVLTNSFSVGAGYEGIYRYAVKQWQGKKGNKNEPVDWFLLPVVGETYDGFLNDIGRMVVKVEHVVKAIDMAANSTGSDRPAHITVAASSTSDDANPTSQAKDATSAPGDKAWRGTPVQEGNSGGGTGMLTTGFKGGTGTASRVVPGIVHGAKTQFTVGCLVQSNFGKLEDLHFGSVPVGRMWKKDHGNDGLIKPGEEEREINKEGSIIAIIATDAPLHPTQLKRLAQRATVGLSRVGGFGSHSSGDIFLAFSTAETNAVPREPDTDENMTTWETRRTARVEKEQEIRVVQDTTINGLFEAVAETVHEAVMNALCAAESTVGVSGNSAEALPLDWLKGRVDEYHKHVGV